MNRNNKGEGRGRMHKGRQLAAPTSAGRAGDAGIAIVTSPGGDTQPLPRHVRRSMECVGGTPLAAVGITPPSPPSPPSLLTLTQLADDCMPHIVQLQRAAGQEMLCSRRRGKQLLRRRWSWGGG